MKFANVSTALLVIILAISLFFIISLFVNLAPDTLDLNMNKWIDILLDWTFILLSISCIALLWMEISNAIADKKLARKSLIFISSLLFVFFVSYLLSDGKLSQFNGAEKYIANGTLSHGILHWIETCLFTSYILIAIAIIGIVYSYIYQLFH